MRTSRMVAGNIAAAKEKGAIAMITHLEWCPAKHGGAGGGWDDRAQIARDAYTSGDLVAAEAYHQYAEHYYRLVAEQDRSRLQ